MSQPALDFQTLRRLLRTELRPYYRDCLWVVAFLLLTAFASAASAWIVKFLIDDIFVHKIAAMIAPVALGIVVIYFAMAIGGYASKAIFAKIAANVVADMRKNITGDLLYRQMDFFDRHDSSDLINRIANVTNSTVDLLRVVILSFVGDFLRVILLVGLMIWLDWRLTLGTMILGPLAIWGVTQINKRIRNSIAGEFNATSQFMQQLYERMRGAALVKSFNNEAHSQAMFATTIDILRKQGARIGRLQALASPMMEVIGGVIFASMVLYSGWAIVNGGKTPGEFVSFIIAFLNAYEPLKRLANMRVQLAKFTVPLNYYYELLDEPSHMMDGTNALEIDQADIQFQNVDFHYRDGKPALRGLSFVAPAGKTTALVGASGAGKTTAFALLQRFYDCNSGVIKINGQDISKCQIKSLRQAIAPIPQDSFIITGTIAENIAIADPNATRQQIENAAKIAHMDEFVDEMEHGYDTPLGEGGYTLSGGQEQRLSIARAVLKDSPILLLDEATSALDSRSESIIQKAISDVSHQKTVLVIAHRLSTIRRADQIIVMEDGCAVEAGTHDELLEKNGIYHQLHQLQFQT